MAAMLQSETDPEEKTALGDAAEFLRTTLADGPRLSIEVISESRELGISEKTLRRAGKKEHVVARKLPSAELGKGRWEWSLPQ